VNGNKPQFGRHSYSTKISAVKGMPSSAALIGFVFGWNQLCLTTLRSYQ
jgi:hypothetical protein